MKRRRFSFSREDKGMTKYEISGKCGQEEKVQKMKSQPTAGQQTRLEFALR